MTFDRRMKRLLPVVGLLAAAVALGACGNGLSPEESGTFQLTQVDGSSPPQVVATQRDTTGATDTTRTLMVVDGSVSVSSDGSATLSISGREVTEADGSQDSNTNNDAVSGSVEGGELVLAADSIDIEQHSFVITSTSAGGSVITVNLDRTQRPFDVSIRLRFEKQ